MNKKIFLAMIAIAIGSMLAIGIPMAQHINADAAIDIVDTKQYNGCGISFDGDDEAYCTVASGATYIIAGIESGEFTFTELQAYVDEMASQPGSASQYQYSFDAAPLEGTSIIKDDQDASDGQGTDTSILEEIGQGYDVLDRLLDRLSEAEMYCEAPPGIPSDWQLHPEALCLAAAMTPIVGAAMANGVVSAFFALFGPAAWATGMFQWLLILRGVGAGELALGLAEGIYNTCMGLLGGSAQQG